MPGTAVRATPGRKPLLEDTSPEARIHAELALKAYQRVMEEGVSVEGAREWQGVRVVPDFDGYGVTITDEIVTLRVLFHNRVAIDTPNRRSLARMRKKLETIVYKTP